MTISSSNKGQFVEPCVNYRVGVVINQTLEYERLNQSFLQAAKVMSHRCHSHVSPLFLLLRCLPLLALHLRNHRLFELRNEGDLASNFGPRSPYLLVEQDQTEMSAQALQLAWVSLCSRLSLGSGLNEQVSDSGISQICKRLYLKFLLFSFSLEK